MMTPLNLGLAEPIPLIDQYPILEIPSGYCWMSPFWKSIVRSHRRVEYLVDLGLYLRRRGGAGRGNYPKERLERRSF